MGDFQLNMREPFLFVVLVLCLVLQCQSTTLQYQRVVPPLYTVEVQQDAAIFWSSEDTSLRKHGTKWHWRGRIPDIRPIESIFHQADEIFNVGAILDVNKSYQVTHMITYGDRNVSIDFLTGGVQAGTSISILKLFQLVRAVIWDCPWELPSPYEDYHSVTSIQFDREHETIKVSANGTAFKTEVHGCDSSATIDRSTLVALARIVTNSSFYALEAEYRESSSAVSPAVKLNVCWDTNICRSVSIVGDTSPQSLFTLMTDMAAISTDSTWVDVPWYTCKLGLGDGPLVIGLVVAFVAAVVVLIVICCLVRRARKSQGKELTQVDKLESALYRYGEDDEF